MKTDIYTKAVLTVIALCLVWMCVNGATPVALAQAGRAQQPMPVVLVNDRGVPINMSGGLPVNFGNEAIPVNVQNIVGVTVGSIQRLGRWDPVVVHVLREPPTLQPIP